MIPSTQVLWNNFKYTHMKGIYLLLLCSLVCSCHSYKPIMKDQQVSPESLQQNIIVGKKYEITTKGKMKMFIRVDSLLDDRMTGDTKMIVNSSSHHQKDYAIFFDQVESVRYQKFSAGKTIAIIVIPIGFFVVLAAEYTMDFEY